MIPEKGPPVSDTRAEDTLENGQSDKVKEDKSSNGTRQ